MNKEYSGKQIKDWLRKSQSGLINNLIGCEISDEVSIWSISNISLSNLTVIDEEDNNDSKEYSFEFLDEKTVFIPEHLSKLIEDIEQNKSPIDILEDDAKLMLNKLSINTNDLDGGATVIKIGKILKAWDHTQIVPDESDRLYIYEKSKKAKSVSRAISPLFKKWCDLIEQKASTYDAISRLHLAVILRVSGKFDESLEVTKILELPQSEFKCNSLVRAMLCCDRAAVYLDKYEKNHNVDFLNEAEKYLKRAYANDQSEEVSTCYQRYNSYMKSL